MKKQINKKGIVVGLIVLFFGASLIPAAIGAVTTEKDTPGILSSGFLMIPDSTAKSIGMYSPFDGTYLGDLFSDPVRFGTPINAVRGPDDNIYVSDQIKDAVFVYDVAGNFLYEYANASDGLDNLRGIAFRGTELFISNGGTAGGAVKCIARFAGPHNRLPNFIQDGIDPFDILFLPDGRCLVSDIAGNQIRLYSENGILQQILFSISFPEQIQFDSLLPGEFLTAAFTTNVIRDFELNGTIVQNTPYTSGRGVFRLGNGNLLVTSSAGIQEIQPGTGTIIQTKKTGSGRFIEFFSTGPNQPPNVPGNPNPGNGSTNVSISASLSWTGGDPDPGDIVTYDVYFGTTSPPPKIVSNQSALSYTPVGMTFNTQYYWKIVAWDHHGATTAGPVWSFTTRTNNPPNTPSNPNPANGAMNIPIIAVLSWTGGDPDPGDTVTYDVYFGTTSPPPKIVSNQSALSYTPVGMTFNTQYYWKIVAWDNFGWMTTGPTWTFTTQINNPPNAPSNPDPENGAENVPLNKVLTWTGGDPDPGDTVTYDVYFGTTSPPPKIVSNQSALSYTPVGMTFNKHYYWKIVSWDSGGLSTHGPLWDFFTITDTTPPTTTHTLNGTIGDGNWYISCVTVTLQATDDVSGVDAIFYRIDEGSWTEYSTPVDVCTDGVHQLWYYAVDKVGNQEEIKGPFNIGIDKTAPVFDEYTFTPLNALKNKWLCKATASDATSGIVKVDFYVDEVLVGSVTTPTTPPNVYEFTYLGKPQTSSYAIAFDAAGNSVKSDIANYVEFSWQQQHYYPYVMITKLNL